MRLRHKPGEDDASSGVVSPPQPAELRLQITDAGFGDGASASAAMRAERSLS